MLNQTQIEELTNNSQDIEELTCTNCNKTFNSWYFLSSDGDHLLIVICNDCVEAIKIRMQEYLKEIEFRKQAWADKVLQNVEENTKCQSE